MRFRFRPLVLALLCFLSGLVPALRFAAPPLPPLLACIGIVALSLLLGRSSHRRTERRQLGLLMAAFALAGVAAGTGARTGAASDCRARLPDGIAIQLRGVLGAGSRGTPGGADGVLLPLEQAHLHWSGGACEGAVRVRLPDGAPDLPAGAAVTLRGEWIRSGPAEAPTPWPRPAAMSGWAVADSMLTSSAPDPLRHPLLTLRGRTERTLRALFPRHFSLTDALLLGRREWMDADSRDRFARAGLVHLLAISGSHVAFLAGVLFLLGGVLRLTRARRALLTLLAVGAYLAMIGAPASAVRAGIMVALATGAHLLQRPSAALPILSAAALLLLAVDPLLALDAGFQLSFAGVLGVLLAGRLPRVPAPPGIARRAWKPMADALAVSATAFLLTAPVAAHHFGYVAPVSVLANLPAVPLTSLALVGVVAALAAYPLSQGLASVLADGAGLALEALDRVASAAAAAPGAQVPVSRLPLGVLLAAALLFVAAHALTRALRSGVRFAAAGGAAAAVLVAGPGLGGVGSRSLEIHFLDVGQGDAVALRTPADRWVLIDAGPPGRNGDAGRRRVLPFLRARGVRRLEALILTHPDADHIGGAATVLREMPVRRVIEPGLPVGKAMYREVLQTVEEQGVPWSAAREGQRLALDGVEVDFLWPDRGGVLVDGETEANQISAVALVRFGAFGALLTGDVSHEVEERLVRRLGARLDVDVLKAGHHGSATSTSAALLSATTPTLVVVSAGRRNRYGHPAPQVLERIRSGGIEVARTDREGTISLRAGARPGSGWSRMD